MVSSDACEWPAAEVAAYVRDGRLREDIAWIPHVPDFDTHTLASTLEAESVTGHALLAGIDMQILKDEFGIRNMNVRTAILSAINQLRQNSRLFSNSGQGNDIVPASLRPSETTTTTQDPLELQPAVAQTSIGTNPRGIEYIEEDASGRKRRKLNLLEPASSINATTVLPSAPAVVTDSEDLPPRSLPDKFTSIDEMFYGNTPFGGEINLELPEALKTDTFSIIADPSCNPDDVQGTARRMKRFLNASKDKITFHGRPAVAIKPYSDATPKGRRRKPRVDQILPDVPPHSITVVQEQSNGKATAVRMDAHKLHLHKHEHVDVPGYPSQYSYLLDKYGNMEDDELLPTLEDDNQSITSSLQAEIEQEADDTATAGRRFTQDQARQIINEAVDAITNAWKEKNLPSLEKNKAWSLWRSTRGIRSIRDFQIETAQNRIEQLQTRLDKAIKEILRSTWSSKTKLTKQCDSVDVTVEDIAEQTWKIEVLQRREEPDHVVHAIKRTAPRAKDGGKSAPKSSSSHDDFIMEDLPEEENVLVEDDRLDLQYQKKTIDEELLETVNDESPSSPVVNDVEDAQSSASRLASDVTSMSHTDKLHEETQTQQDVEVDSEPVVLEDDNEDHGSDDDLPSPSQLTRTPQPARGERPPQEVIVLSSDTPSPKPQSPKASSSKALTTEPLPDPVLLAAQFRRKEELEDNPFDATIEEVKAWNLDEIKHKIPVNVKQMMIKLVYDMDSGQRKILLQYISRGSISACFEDVKSVIENFPQASGPIGEKSKGESLAMVHAARLYLCWHWEWSDYWFYTPVECAEPFVRPKAEEWHEGSFRNWHNVLLKALQKAERVVTIIDDSDEADSAELVTKKGKKRIQKDKSAEKLRKQALQRQEDLPQQSSHDGKVSQMIAAGRLDGDEVALFAPQDTDPSQHVYLNKYFSQKFLPHQVQGIRFMWRELTVPDHEGGQGAILGHTMGIGKTAQAIGLLVTIAETLRSEQKRALIPESMREQRVLILCPPGLVINWQEELLFWDRDKTLGHAYSTDSDNNNNSAHDQLADLRTWKALGGVLLIGYRLFQKYINGVTPSRALGVSLTTEEKEERTNILLQVPTIVIADEAHALNHQGTKLSLAAKEIVTQRRVGLTATPMSNNTQEIFSLISWAAPNYLGSADEFKAFWADPIEKGAFKDASKDLVRRSIKKLTGLYKVIAPKLDRAGTEILEKTIPPKVEFVLTIPLTVLQNKLYVKLVEQQKSSAAPSSLFGWLATVRLLCGHPFVLRKKLMEEPAKKDQRSQRQEPVSDTYGEADVEMLEGPKDEDVVVEIGENEKRDLLNDITEQWNVSDSYKAFLVQKIISRSVKAKEKVLLFSQSLASLDYLAQLLKNCGWRSGRLDGSLSLRKRQEILKNMEKGDFDVLLISTTAAGQGLNIQAASRVIVYDFGFNPSWESQAIARCYRIGQKKPTFVYRLLVGGTSEEVLYDRALYKRLLASRVVDKKNPERNAKREPREWLNLPGLIPKEDLTAELGKDPLVLDHILAQSQDGGSFIRSIKTEETLSKEADDQPLTEAEQREVEGEIAHAAIMSGKGKGRAL